MRTLVYLVMASLLATGCTAPQTYDLMQTPILYVDSSLDPFAHLPEELKNPQSTIFYATNRAPSRSGSPTKPYSNSISETLRFGTATVRMGGQNTDWETLHHSSLSAQRSNPILISLEQTEEAASLSQADTPQNKPIDAELKEFFKQINGELAKVVDKEIMVYVHGTKVDFTNATVLTAEVEHFAGRDFVSVAYAWPSHQNIFSYLLGTDVKRARDSSPALTELLILLARQTEAKKINILSYSAGGRVASKALEELRQQFEHLNTEQLKKEFRIGSVIFAAADVEIDVFLERLRAASDFADQVVITISDKDNALQAAHKYMGGQVRAGTTEAEGNELDFIASENLDNVSIIDVSLGQNQRGFDIIGHHYWYRHPWMSSDIIFIMRTDLPPQRRGLQPAEVSSLWYLSADYPQQVKEAAANELGSQW
ncbi:MAG: alpha/beta hydrolase [Desulfocapsaceae bacterium]